MFFYRATFFKRFDEKELSRRLKKFNSFNIYAFFIITTYIAILFERGYLFKII